MDNLTRREALKRGATLGGMLLWTTPAVQAIGMSRALAQETSRPCKTYCIKYEFEGSDNSLKGRWRGLGRSTSTSRGNCLVCPSDAVRDDLPDNLTVGFLVEGHRKTGVSVTLSESCSLAETDSTPDEYHSGPVVAAKCGNAECSIQPAVVGADGRIFIAACAPPSGHAISHIELIVRCCS